ncbi:MAG: hypothetical protein ACREUG_09515 [Steroidobacteraceae bacterium]
MKRIGMLAVALISGACIVAHSAAAAPTAATARQSCAPASDLHFVCGLINVEDFVPVEGGRWLVGGSYQAGSAGLYLIDTGAKTAMPVKLSIAPHPDPMYRGCAAPPLGGLFTHGLDAVPGRGGSTTVYAVNHGGRESIEIFRLRAARDSAEWVGCVALPEGASGNAVAALPDGGFVVSKFTDTRDKQAFQHIFAGKITGVVYLWRPGKGFREVPGTRLCGDNGVVVTRDGKWLIVNAWGANEIYRVPLSGRGAITHVKVDFHPDNLRWAPDGTLFDTGQLFGPGASAGIHAWATVRLDPRTLSVTPIVKEPGYKEFSDATSTVQVGRTLWFGTFRGDRVAYRTTQRR